MAITIDNYLSNSIYTDIPYTPETHSQKKNSTMMEPCVTRSSEKARAPTAVPKQPSRTLNKKLSQEFQSEPDESEVEGSEQTRLKGEIVYTNRKTSPCYF